MTLRPYLLAVVALGLGVLVAVQYWPQVAVAPRIAPDVTKPVVGLMLNPLSQKTDADFAALFDHPLFAPTRQAAKVAAPGAPVAAASSDPPPPAPAPPAGPPQPVLMGTVTSPWPGGADLGDDQGGPVVFLRPGQVAMSLHLEAVQPDRATFMGPDGEVTLILRKVDAVAAPSQPGKALTGAAMPAP